MSFQQREVEIGMTGWAGIYWQRVLVIGETPKRYRVRPLGTPGHTKVTLTGGRSITWPASALVPKHAVREVRQ